MYNKIEIHTTEFEDKFLVISNNKSLYVGVIAKDVINLLKEECSDDLILHKINKRYNIDLNLSVIQDIKASVEKLFINDTINLYKVVNFFNPSKIHFPHFFVQIFSKVFFYITFTILFVLNLIYYINVTKYDSNDNYSKTIVLIIVLVILFLHEIGHIISAKKFNVNVAEIGFGIYNIFPVFYVNLNESWKVKKDKRVIINLSGIYTQLIIGIFLVFLILFFKHNGEIIVIFKINFFVILVNLNPFLKFDGYWILADLMENNNLIKSSNTLLKNKFKSREVSKYRFELIIYTILRVFFITALIFVISKKFFVIGKKLLSNIAFDFNEYIFILIIIFYIGKVFISTIKNNLK